MKEKSHEIYCLLDSGFEEEEESEIKLLTFIGSWRKQRSSRKTLTSVSVTMTKPLTVRSQQTENS